MLTVEDGTGVVDANAYVSLADCNEYHTQRQSLSWLEANPATQEAAIIKATQFIDARYGRSFRGIRTHGRDQALEWPRKNVRDTAGLFVDSDSVPREIVVATCEAALRALGADLEPDPSDAHVQSESVTVGPIQESKTYFQAQRSRPVYRAIDDIVSVVMTRTGGVSWLERA